MSLEDKCSEHFWHVQSQLAGRKPRLISNWYYVYLSQEVNIRHYLQPETALLRTVGWHKILQNHQCPQNENRRTVARMIYRCETWSLMKAGENTLEVRRERCCEWSLEYLIATTLIIRFSIQCVKVIVVVVKDSKTIGEDRLLVLLTTDGHRVSLVVSTGKKQPLGRPPWRWRVYVEVKIWVVGGDKRFKTERLARRTSVTSNWWKF